MTSSSALDLVLEPFDSTSFIQEHFLLIKSEHQREGQLAKIKTSAFFYQSGFKCKDKQKPEIQV